MAVAVPAPQRLMMDWGGGTGTARASPRCIMRRLGTAAGMQARCPTLAGAVQCSTLLNLVEQLGPHWRSLKM